VGPFSINNRILYCLEFGASPGPIYSYRTSPPIICVAKTSENKKTSRQEKRIFFIIVVMAGNDGIKANKNRRLCKAGGGLNLLTGVLILSYQYHRSFLFYLIVQVINSLGIPDIGGCLLRTATKFTIPA